MKFIAFNGSPSGENSATKKMINSFLEGAKDAGAEVESYNLIDYDIKQCKGCFACWFQTPGKCVINDDMKNLLQAYQTADVVCFGSPVFSWNMTGILKNFVDRLVVLKSPLIAQEEGSFDMEDSKVRNQKYVAISNAGFPGEKNFEIIKAAFSCCNPSLEIYRNCGKLLKSKNPSVKSVVKEYLDTVKQCGYEMASEGKVSETSLKNLEMPLMSTEEYVKFLGM
ncbi:MAG: flavodoxin family protein [Peptostreptococcus sp.]|uniref:flavodoxin family protein n=1 Tax=Peptostreptococcus sp. TaxID=1262 RepID=UPI002FC7D678